MKISNHESAEAQIRQLIEARVVAIREKDVDAATAILAPDALLYDALPPLKRSGAAAIRAKTAEWAGWYDGPIGYEIRDLSVTAGADVAFCHYLNRVSGTMTNGSSVAMWLRSTVCFRKTAGSWTIVHEHTSVPFDPENGQASLTIQP